MGDVIVENAHILSVPQPRSLAPSTGRHAQSLHLIGTPSEEKAQSPSHAQPASDVPNPSRDRQSAEQPVTNCWEADPGVSTATPVAAADAATAAAADDATAVTDDIDADQSPVPGLDTINPLGASGAQGLVSEPNRSDEDGTPIPTTAPTTRGRTRSASGATAAAALRKAQAVSRAVAAATALKAEAERKAIAAAAVLKAQADRQAAEEGRQSNKGKEAAAQLVGEAVGGGKQPGLRGGHSGKAKRYTPTVAALLAGWKIEELVTKVATIKEKLNRLPLHQVRRILPSFTR